MAQPFLRFFVCFPTQRLICWFRTLKSVLFKKVLEYTFNSILMLKGLMDKQYNNNNYLLLSADSVIDMLHVVSQYSKICLELSLILSLMLRNVCVLNHFSHVQVFASLSIVDCQAPLSMGFSRQEYCSGLPCPPPGDLPDPGIEPMSPVAPALQADSLPLSHQGSPLYLTIRH